MGKVVAVGNLYLDINSTDFPFDSAGLAPNKEYLGADYEIKAGGSAFNFAAVCASLGLESMVIGKTGQDEIGHVVSRLITDARIEPSLIQSPDVITNVSVNLINSSDEAILPVIGTANQSLSASEVENKLNQIIDNIDYLYIGGIFKLKSLLPAAADIFAKVREQGVKIIFDHNRIPGGTSNEDREIVRNLALTADYYLPSKDEFLELWAVDSIERGLEQLRNQTDALVVVKDGSRGAISLVGSGFVRAPAFEVKVNHSVGAGDSFDAGLLAALDRGEGLEQSMNYGCAAAALKISESHLPTDSAVQALIK